MLERNNKLKKILFIIILFLINLGIVNAQTLESVDLPYYVRIKEGGVSDYQIVRVKKIYDKDTLDVVFSIDFHDYEVGNNFIKYDIYDKNIWSRNIYFINTFNNIVYYGYNQNKTDLYYFLTQLFIWNEYYNYDVYVSDEYGNLITDYNNEYYNLFNNYQMHNASLPFFNKTYDGRVFKTDKYNYGNRYIFDNPDTDAFEIKNDNKDLYITPKIPGEYKLIFTKKYTQENHCYSDGKNIYWQSLGGPTDIEFYLNYIVEGIKLNIQENLNGINNHFGDAKINELKYELYLNDSKIQDIIPENDINLGTNLSYILKDLSNTTGYYKMDDISFNTLNNDYTLIIDRYVINKNITLDIFSDKTYYVYLKSNNELYETFDKNTDLITLPYGTYYIKSKDNSYYKELEVLDNIDYVLTIEEDIKINNIESLNVNKDIKSDKKVLVEKPSNDIILASEPEIVLEPKKNNYDINKVDINPKTNDYIYIYLLSFILSLTLFVFLIKKKGCDNNGNN